jgi:hypothetical protein
VHTMAIQSLVMILASSHALVATRIAQPLGLEASAIPALAVRLAIALCEPLTTRL